MPKMVTVHGLKTCDTTRAARRWLDAHGVIYAFHDVREDGLTQAQVDGWVKQLESEKSGLDARKAVALLLAHPTLVKRPLLDRGGKLSLGFKPADYASLFD
jgi:arsenate reductase